MSVLCALASAFGWNPHLLAPMSATREQPSVIHNLAIGFIGAFSGLGLAYAKQWRVRGEVAFTILALSGLCLGWKGVAALTLLAASLALTTTILRVSSPESARFYFCLLIAMSIYLSNPSLFENWKTGQLDSPFAYLVAWVAVFFLFRINDMIVTCQTG